MGGQADIKLEEFVAQAMKVPVTLSPAQIGLIEQFCTMLAEYNAHTNLVSNAEPRVVLADHVMDALTLIPAIEKFRHAQPKQEHPLKLMDVGCGAGLPGLILAIACEGIDVTLVDSVAKKIRFVDSFLSASGLMNRARALSARAEDLAHQPRYRESFDLVTARAVGSTELVAEICLPLLRLGGQFFLQKSGAQLDSENRDVTKTLSLLGGTIGETTRVPYEVLQKDRAIVVIEKTERTKTLYPRRWPQMKSEPLLS